MGREGGLARMDAQNERTFQSEIMYLARLTGWLVWHFNDSRRQVAAGRFVGDKDAAGFPDLVLARERVVFIEVKTLKGKLSDKQRRCIQALEDAGQEVYVFRPDDWDTIKRVLARRREI